MPGVHECRRIMGFHTKRVQGGSGIFKQNVGKKLTIRPHAIECFQAADRNQQRPRTGASIYDWSRRINIACPETHGGSQPVHIAVKRQKARQILFHFHAQILPVLLETNRQVAHIGLDDYRRFAV
ncbi:hypothetical protein D1872_257000 [compost metagenome]